MNLRPEQQQALRYLERKGTHASLESIRRRVRQTFARLEEVLDSLDPSQAATSPEPGRWSCHEIVDHLVESHRPAVEQLRVCLRGEDPGEPIPAGLLSADPGSKSWAQLVAELKAVQSSFAAILDGATDLPSASRVPVVMVVKAATADGSTETLEWIERLDWKAFAVATRAHTLEHVVQLERTLKQVIPKD